MWTKGNELDAADFCEKRGYILWFYGVDHTDSNFPAYRLCYVDPKGTPGNFYPQGGDKQQNPMAVDPVYFDADESPKDYCYAFNSEYLGKSQSEVDLIVQTSMLPHLSN